MANVSATHIEECIGNYAHYLASGGQVLNWVDVFDSKNLSPTEVLQFLIESYIIFGQKTSLASHPDRLEAFDQVVNSCLHDLLIYVREGRSMAMEDWRYLQSYLYKAFNQKNADKTLLHRLVLQVSEVGFQLSPELLDLSRYWMEKRFEEDLIAENLQHAKVQPLDGFVGQLLVEAEVCDEFSFYEAFSNQVAYLSLEALVELFAQALHSNHPVIKEAAGLFVLHPQPSVRLQALKIFNVFPDLVSLCTLDRLVKIRNWHTKADRELLDLCIRKIRLNVPSLVIHTDHAVENEADVLQQQSHNLEETPKVTQILVTPIKHMASTIDGSGAQNIVSFFKVGSEFQILGGVVKEKVGWIDLWVSVPTTRKECELMLREMKQELFSLEVSEAYVHRLIPIGLGWNLARAELASPLLLEWSERLGVSDLNPQIEQEELLLGEMVQISTNVLEKAFQRKALKSSQAWLAGKGFSVGWYESNEETEQCIDELLCELEDQGESALGEHQVVDQVVRNLLEPQREKWFRRFVRMAYWAKENEKKRGPNWEEFLVIAILLKGQKPLEDIPLMREISVCTLSYHLPCAEPNAH